MHWAMQHTETATSFVATGIHQLRTAGNTTLAASRQVRDNRRLVNLCAMTMPDFACNRCGACCAAFRVDFHCADLASSENAGVPVALTVPLTATLVRMRGTDAAPPRCIALEGEVGVAVRCTIYEHRPGPCRDFAPYAPLGIGDDACDRARRRHGLPPL